MKRKLHCILLIDDDAATNFLNNTIIEDADCAEQVSTRQTAKAALNYLSEASQVSRKNLSCFPDLIFLDINMPAMDGWEFLGKYRELQNQFPSTPVIVMLSTSINPDDRRRANSIPEVAEFCNKPITPEIIVDIVAKHFPERT